MESSYGNPNGDQSTMIIEGFICPECQMDMSSIEMLQAHFQLVHSNKTRNHSATSNPKNSQFAQNNISNAAMKELFSANQSPGKVTSHTSYYKQMRDQTIGRYVIQTNKLLIILDKLITIDLNSLNDDAKRDAHYKSIVPWVKDVDVNLCPNCARSFNILYRKHHCRLCGAIMCNQCSQFISFTLAKHLTEPDTLSQSIEHNSVQPDFKLRRSESITSLNSYFFKSSSRSKNLNSNDSDLSSLNKNKLSQIYLRLCNNCSLLLEKKYKSFKDKMVKPYFVNHYNELYSCISEANRLYPIFSKMSESLSSGEAIYQLGNAEEMRSKLIKLFQQAELLSGHILKFMPPTKSNASNNNKPPSVNKDQLKLQRNIRQYVINYLKEHSFSLGQLPTKEVYLTMKAQRQVSLQEEMKRIEREQNLQKIQLDELAKRQRFSHKALSLEDNFQRNKNEINCKVSIDKSDGWLPNVKSFHKQETFAENETEGNSDRNDNNLSVQDKALRVQIQLVESYLEEALKQNKYEEADLLQKNLNELLDMQEKI